MSPVPDDFSRRHAADAAFLGLHGEDEGRFRFTVVDRLSRMDARLYGGTAIAVSIAAAEELTKRPVLWMTTQFVATAAQDTEIDVLAEVLAPGNGPTRSGSPAPAPTARPSSPRSAPPGTTARTA